DSSGGGDGNSGGTSGGPIPPDYNADMESGDGGEKAIPVTVDNGSGTASVNVGSLNLAHGGGAAITMPTVPGAAKYAVGIPAASLAIPNGGALTFTTAIGSLTIPSNMLSGIAGVEGKKAEIIIGQGDKSKLPEDIRAAIGDRPLISLTLALDGKQTDWNNPDAPVTVSIPYIPSAGELANPDNIVVWYIDGSGNAVCVPNGRYDPDTGTVTFTTTHFSYYAVSFRQVSFEDVPKDAWYARAVSFIAARDITTGTGGGNFSPEAKLTRGQFIVMLLKAYGIDPDTNPKNNFADAGNTWYTGYLAAAKRLGISAGVGNNLFAPGKEITRQEMFTMLYNALKVIGKLPAGNSGKSISEFSDAGDIAPWAWEAMKLLVETGTISGSGNRLSPKDTTTRAQIAQVLYNLLEK
ncbi:MAG: S-layer homology domain-containing protein, partial [Bacillota bacterium]